MGNSNESLKSRGIEGNGSHRPGSRTVGLRRWWNHRDNKRAVAAKGQSRTGATNSDAGDAFGASVSIDFSGDALAVGAGNEDSNAVDVGGDQSDNSVSNAGAAYLY